MLVGLRGPEDFAAGERQPAGQAGDPEAEAEHMDLPDLVPAPRAVRPSQHLLPAACCLVRRHAGGCPGGIFARLLVFQQYDEEEREEEEEEHVHEVEACLPCRQYNAK